MTLDQLHIFLEVARRQHVTQAARVLNLTQSAVSAAVAALEDQHGVALFDRIGRGIVLNEAGRRFVPHAEAVLRRANEAGDWLAEIRGGTGGSLRIQASQTVASYHLPRHLIRFRALYPGVALAFRQGNTASVARAVLEGEADLGVVEGRVAHPDLSVERIAGDRLLLVVGRDHPWRDGRPLPPAALATTPWVLREPGSGTRAAFDEALALRGIAAAALTVLLELPSNEACIAAVETGRCATALSELAAAPHLAQGQIFEAGFDLPRRDFSLLRHRARHLSGTARNFAALLRDVPEGGE